MMKSKDKIVPLILKLQINFLECQLLLMHLVFPSFQMFTWAHRLQKKPQEIKKFGFKEMLQNHRKYKEKEQQNGLSEKIKLPGAPLCCAWREGHNVNIMPDGSVRGLIPAYKQPFFTVGNVIIRCLYSPSLDIRL